VDANELARKVAGAMLEAEGTGPAWGINIEEARAGYARLSMRVRADMLNGHRTVHGGMVFALADTAFAYVCNGRNEKTVAAQASIVFLDSAKEGETLVAEAEEAAVAGSYRGGPLDSGVHWLFPNDRRRNGRALNCHHAATPSGPFGICLPFTISVPTTMDPKRSTAPTIVVVPRYFPLVWASAVDR
jgi:acyl-CoA thioesterase